MITGIHLHLILPNLPHWLGSLIFLLHFNFTVSSIGAVVTTTPVIPAQVAIILPPALAGFSHWLRGAGLPQWLNIVISLTALILIGAFCAWVTNGFTDFQQSSLVVLGFVTLISGGKEMIDLFSYLEMNPSPLLAVVPAKEQTMPVLEVSTVNSPKPIILSATTSGITPIVINTPAAAGNVAQMPIVPPSVPPTVA